MGGGAEHNPLGVFSVMTFWVFVRLHVLTGLFANDNIPNEAPLVKFISKKSRNLITSLRKLNQKLLLILIASHIGAILFYFIYRKINLIYPMAQNDKEYAGFNKESKLIALQDNGLIHFGALVILTESIGLVFELVHL